VSPVAKSLLLFRRFLHTTRIGSAIVHAFWDNLQSSAVCIRLLPSPTEVNPLPFVSTTLFRLQKIHLSVSRHIRSGRSASMTKVSANRITSSDWLPPAVSKSWLLVVLYHSVMMEIRSYCPMGKSSGRMQLFSVRATNHPGQRYLIVGFYSLFHHRCGFLKFAL
jgi:hypothetical protein